MENILSRRVSTIVWVVFIGIFTAFVCAPAVSAQEESSLAPEKVAQYEAYVSKGNQLLDQGKYREAISEFNRALLLNPNSQEAKRGVIEANQEIAARSAVPDISTIEEEASVEEIKEAVQKMKMTQ